MDDAGAIQRWKPEERFGQSELISVASPLQRECWDELDRRVDAALQNQLALRTTAKQSPKDDDQAKAVAQLAAKAADREALEAEQARQELMTELQVYAFQSLSYAEPLTRCERPENVEGPSETAWVPDGHPKLLHLWPPKLLQAGRPNWRFFLVGGNTAFCR